MMTRSALGLPWHLKDDEKGFEIKCSPTGWLTRIVLDDTIGNRPRDEEPEFRAAQKEHADFIMLAVNAHHDLLEALQAVYPKLLDGSFYEDHDDAARLLGTVRRAIETGGALP